MFQIKKSLKCNNTLNPNQVNEVWYAVCDIYNNMAEWTLNNFECYKIERKEEIPLETTVVILVNYNGYNDTVECVNSIKNLQYELQF